MRLTCGPALAALLVGLSAAPVSADSPIVECRVAGIRNSVQCGSVSRALDPEQPSAGSIEVHYVVVPAMARRKLPDPVFVLAGGPGQSAISVAPQMMALLSRLGNRRDIVFVDQRGTGRSAPLECADPAHETLAEQSDRERQIRRVMACKAKLVALPYIRTEANLGFFTTVIAVQDLDAVRRRLGAQRIDLIGASYGTRVGLEYLRRYPGAVRRLVLDGVAPADMALPASFSTDGQAAFDAMLDGCSQETACAAAYPRLKADWQSLLRSLPREVTVAHPLTGLAETFTLTREMVLGAVRGPLYAPFIAAGLPAAIEAAVHGRFDALMGLNSTFSSAPSTRLAMGMHLSVVCAEDEPRVAASTDAPGRDFGADYARFYQRACAGWPRGAVPAAFYEIPPSASPVLLMSGGLDPATPPRHGARAAASLGRMAQHVVVPNAGHGILAIGCMRDVVFRFIDAETDAAATAVDAACVKAIPRPSAFEPVRIDMASRP